MAKTLNMIIGIIVLLIGAFYTFFPHSIHISSGLDFGLTHGVHIVIGVVMLVIGGFLIWKGRKWFIELYPIWFKERLLIFNRTGRIT